MNRVKYIFPISEDKISLWLCLSKVFNAVFYDKKCFLIFMKIIFAYFQNYDEHVLIFKVVIKSAKQHGAFKVEEDNYSLSPIFNSKIHSYWSKVYT